MLSNAYFLAKFRFDTAENEPAKNLQNFANFANFVNCTQLRSASWPAAGLILERRNVAAGHDGVLEARVLRKPLRDHRFAGAWGKETIE